MSNIIDSYKPLINNHMNWPFSAYLDGENMLDIVNPNDQNILLKVSELDAHPNEKGHKAIADFLRKEIT